MWKVIKTIFVTLTIAYLMAPMAIVLTISFSSADFLTFPPPGFSLRWYRTLFTDAQWADTLLNSVQIVVPTCFLATICGVSAAIALTRTTFPGRGIVLGFLMAPLITPIIVIGAGIYEFYVAIGWTGSLVGFVIAHTMLSIPYVISIVMASMSTLSDQFEKAAATLGANSWLTFRRVLLPLLLPSILSGALFAIVVSFDEVVVSLFISTPLFRPVSVQMWSDVLGDINPTIAAVGSLLFMFSVTAVALEAVVRRTASSNSQAARS